MSTTPAHARGSLPIGTVIDDRFELVELLGVGAFGAVYRARQLFLGLPLREVALKLFAANKIRKENVREVFSDQSHHEGGCDGRGNRGPSRGAPGPRLNAVLRVAGRERDHTSRTPVRIHTLQDPRALAGQTLRWKRLVGCKRHDITDLVDRARQPRAPGLARRAGP